MSKNRARLKKLIALIILLVFAYFLKDFAVTFFASKPQQPSSSLEKSAISEILIKNDKQEFSLYKKGGRWLTKKAGEEFQADEEKISQIIESIAVLKKDEIVSKNKNKHEEFGIGNQTITLKSGGKSYVIFVGDSAGITKNYVRIDDENEVFAATGFDTVFADTDFLDLSLHLIKDENFITSVTTYLEGNTLSLEKKGNDWKIEDRTAKKDRVDFFLNDLKTLKAKDILKKQENYLDVNPILSIIIKENNKEKNIGFYSQNEEEYFVRINPSSYDYIVASGFVASLKKEEKDFFE
ncbi:DUF4340 domain-containing protein [Candidatus Roizmanbacteria bacterium]|nr:DUF4340 domain-containing protein [Candidatus Roizmanbacteria bacterium]